MTLDQAREEYQHALRSTYVDRGEPDVGRTYYLVDEDKADALIAALTADNDALAGELGRKNDRNRQLTASVEELERERDAYANAASDCHMWQLRAEQAERDQALFVADGWHRQFKRAAKARREEKARAKKATEYARIEVKRKNEAVEREAAAIECAEQAEAERDEARAEAAALRGPVHELQEELSEARAELAAVKERRCEGCDLWQEWKPGLWDCAEEWCGYSTKPDEFCCIHFTPSRWEKA